MSARRAVRALGLFVGVALAGCGDSGVSVELDVTTRCVGDATDLVLDLTPTPGTTKHQVLAGFLPAHRRVVVLPPDGATRLDVTATIVDAQQVARATAQTTIALPAAGRVTASLALVGESCGDGGAPDTLAPPDLADGGSADALAGDAAPAPDLAVDGAPPVDATAPADLSLAADLSFDATPAPDLRGPVDQALAATFPSHVASHYLTDGTCDLHFTVDTAVDTSAMTIDSAVPPSGCVSAVEVVAGTPVWVLAVHDITIDPGVAVRVTGSRGLVVVASDVAEIDGILAVKAIGATPGPGGAAPGAGLGHGGAGASSVGVASGGGGAAYGGAGANGGDADDSAGHHAAGGTGGATVGDGDPALVGILPGGAGGGAGGTPGCTAAVGGAGGGALQITAAVALHLGPGGVIDAGGGGGHAGCSDSAGDSGGGGGGAGGSVYLESPIITMLEPATIVANGGAGGAGADSTTPMAVPTDGANATQNDLPAAGGAAGPTTRSSDGGNGGATIHEATGAASASHTTGGGGGGYGRIVVRSHGIADLAGGLSSPPPVQATDL